MNKSVKNKINVKRKAWIKYKRSLRPLDYLTYTQCRNDCTAAVRKAKYEFERNLVNGIKVNPKRFWRYVASQTKVKHHVSGVLKPNSSLTVDDKDTANTLNYFFSSVFTQENADYIPSFETRNVGSSLTHVAITVDDVWNQLCKLKPYKSGGPDNCHPRVLLELKESVVQPLYLIFSKSLRDGILPTMWKKATVTAIHKKGDRNLCNNYRPVSRTSVIVKMLEAIIKYELMQYFKSENLLSICQHGFRSSHSCVTQLL